MTHRVLALAAVWLLACADLPEIATDVCGNNVLEQDEDCDGFSAFGEGTGCGAIDTANACHYVCTDGAVCPDGWGCGIDGQCRRPTGAFEPGPGSPWRFRVGPFAIGDVDGDGRNDLVGSGAANLSIRFGTAEGGFPTEVDLLIRRPNGPVSFGRFDQNDQLDVVIPTEGGIFSLVGVAGGLEPLAYTSIALPAASSIKAAALEAVPGNFVSEVLLLYENTMEFTGSSNVSQLPGAFAAQNLAGRIPAADLDGNGRMELALAFSQADDVYVYTPTGLTTQVLQASPYATLSLPLGMKVRAGARFADVDGDGDLDLLISAQGPARTRVLVSYNTGGTLGALEPFAVLDEISDIEHWPLAAGDLSGDAIADFVLPRAVVVALRTGTSGPPTGLFPLAGNQTNPWAEAAIADFNGDGWQDVAAVIEGVDGVDVFLNSGAVLLNRFRVDTERPPRTLRPGDYDGDRIPDLAFSELGLFDSPDRLTVIFGSTSGGPSEAVPMAQLDFIEVMEPLITVLSAEGFDFITDLLVVSASFPSRDDRLLTFMQGNSSRRMLAPFILSPALGAGDDQPRWVLVGNFTLADDGARDLLALADERGDVLSGDTQPLEAPSRMYMVPGQGGEGDLDATGQLVIDMPESAAFDHRCAVFTVGDIDVTGDSLGRDEVVGVDRGGDCFGDVGSPEPRLVTVRTGPGGIDVDPVTLPGNYRVPRKAAMHDLDGDGDLDLLVLFAGAYKREQQPTEAAVAVVWNVDGALSLADISVLQLAGAGHLYDVAPLNADADGVPELLVQSRGGLFLSRLDPDTVSYGSPEKLDDRGPNGSLATGDLDGDGLDDIAYTDGNDVRILLQRQGVPLGAALEDGPDAGASP